MDKAAWQEKGAGHRGRLREKFLDLGIGGLTDSEILELLLGFGTPRKDCKEAARGLLAAFGSLAGVLDAGRAELQQVKGVGPKNSFALHFVHGVARRYLKERLKGKQVVRSSAEVADYLIHSMRGLGREVLTVLFLDAGHGIIESEVVAEGTLTSNTIHPREVVERALHHRAAALIIAHNHPSGNMEPSEADRHLTRRLYLALALLNINLLDHFIVGAAPAPYSFADHGLMGAIREECAALIQG